MNNDSTKESIVRERSYMNRFIPERRIRSKGNEKTRNVCEKACTYSRRNKKNEDHFHQQQNMKTVEK